MGALCEQSNLVPLFVTADREVAEWAANNGFPSVAERRPGLDQAARAGAEWARASNSSHIVIHADLPLLSAVELTQFSDIGQSGVEVIAPSADGGTSAISAKTPIEYSYGPGSFHRHLRQMNNPVVVATMGFLHDLDSPKDLESASKHPRGSWLTGVVA
jgi:2-phospho-L-lactate guanylyltransferase (CobY/MobA/RfbA family)